MSSSSGSCSARLGRTTEEPETRPGAEHGGPAPPRAPEPGTRASSPGASGRAFAAHAGCAVCGDPGGETQHGAGGRRGLPGVAGGPDSANGGPLPPGEDAPAALTPGLRRVPHGRGRSSPCTPTGSVHSQGGREPHCSRPPSLVCAMTSIPSQKQNIV